MRVPAILLLLVPLTWAAFGAPVQEPGSEPPRPEVRPDPAARPLSLAEKNEIAKPRTVAAEPLRAGPGGPYSDPPPPDPFIHPPTYPIEIGPGPEIRGRVIDEQGNPLCDFTVRTETRRTSGRGCYKPRLRAGAGENLGYGRFLFRLDATMLERVPEPQRAGPFTILADGYLPVAVDLTGEPWERLARGIDVVGLEIRLRRSAVIRGRVLGPGGRGVSGARVWRKPSPGAGKAWREALTDARGGFEIRGADPERKDFLVASDDRRSSGHLSLEGRLAGGETLDAEFVLDPPRDVRLTVVLNGFVRETEVALDRRQVESPGPVTTVQTCHGAHELEIGCPGRKNVSVVFEVPPDTRAHLLTIDLPE